MTFNEELRAALDHLSAEDRRLIERAATTLTHAFVNGRKASQEYFDQQALPAVQAAACSFVALGLACLSTAAICGKSVDYTRQEWLDLAAAAWESTTVELEPVLAGLSSSEVN